MCPMAPFHVSDLSPVFVLQVCSWGTGHHCVPRLKPWILGAWLQITVELYFPLSSVLSSAMILLLCWYAVTPSFSIIKSPECRGFSIRVSFTFNKRGKWRHTVSNEKVSSTKNSKIYLRQPRIEVENLNLLWITEKRREQPDNRRREVGNMVKRKA